MKNNTIVVILLVIVALGITLFFINRKKELNDTQTPSVVTTTTQDTPELETQTEVVTPTIVEPANPSLPQTGYEPK